MRRHRKPGGEAVTLDLEELERLEREATPGPWRRDADYPQLVAGMASVPGGVPYFAPADAALIVAARNQLPALLAELRALRAVAEAADVHTTEGRATFETFADLRGALDAWRGLRR